MCGIILPIPSYIRLACKKNVCQVKFSRVRPSCFLQKLPDFLKICFDRIGSICFSKLNVLIRLSRHITASPNCTYDPCRRFFSFRTCRQKRRQFPRTFCSFQNYRQLVKFRNCYLCTLFKYCNNQWQNFRLPAEEIDIFQFAQFTLCVLLFAIMQILLNIFIYSESCYKNVTGVPQRRKELLADQIMTVNKKHQFISLLASHCACK